jgi:hypothetical protein
VDVRDRVSGAEASMTLAEERTFDGVRFPAAIRVEGAGRAYVDHVERIEAVR